jgi:hypothetical protein
MRLTLYTPSWTRIIHELFVAPFFFFDFDFDAVGLVVARFEHGGVGIVVRSSCGERGDGAGLRGWFFGWHDFSREGRDGAGGLGWHGVCEMVGIF